MKKTIIYCDVCGKQITGRVYKVGFGVVEGDQINGDEVFEDIEQDMDFCVNCIEEVAEMVRNCKDRMTASTLEVEEPVRHGRWLPKHHYIAGYEFVSGHICSECGDDAMNAEGDDFLTDFCPNCGARMDKK